MLCPSIPALTITEEVRKKGVTEEEVGSDLSQQLSQVWDSESANSVENNNALGFHLQTDFSPVELDSAIHSSQFQLPQSYYRAQPPPTLSHLSAVYPHLSICHSDSLIFTILTIPTIPTILITSNTTNTATSYLEQPLPPGPCPPHHQVQGLRQVGLSSERKEIFIFIFLLGLFVPTTAGWRSSVQFKVQFKSSSFQ